MPKEEQKKNETEFSKKPERPTIQNVMKKINAYKGMGVTFTADEVLNLVLELIRAIRAMTVLELSIFMGNVK